MRASFEGKSVDVTQGGLIVSASAVTLVQDRDGQGKVMNGEKSDVGIVVIKFARKTAKANEWVRVIHASTDSKGGDLCEARNRGRRGM